MRQVILFFSLLISIIYHPLYAQEENPATSLWSPDLSPDQYRNPIIFADYSDPDAIRVGDDYYLVSSSFSHFPGLPILHSMDLIHWTIVGHAVQNYPSPEFDLPQHGNAIWAPSIRYHDEEFYIFFGDPDRGVFMTKSKKAVGPWQPLQLIKKVTGWIDCCPFWDEDGSAYLVHAFANSRSGIKSLLAMNKMKPDGTQIYDDGILVFNGQKNHPTIEGPKLYKRNGYYYIFAPAGGVKTGWQTTLRSKNIFGPYEDKITLEQGSSNINGPHQGAWVTTTTGEDWFLHFQDRYAYGRVVLLEPMRWEEDWPVMGVDRDHNGIGEPVNAFLKPKISQIGTIGIPQTTDEFNTPSLGLQWQWQSNFRPDWFSLTTNPGSLRLYAGVHTHSDANLWNTSRLLMQKIPAPKSTTITKLDLRSNNIGAKAGLLVFGMDYAYIAIEKNKKWYTLSQVICKNAINGKSEEKIETVNLNTSAVYFKVNINTEKEDDIIPKVLCEFSYSADGVKYLPLGKTFVAKEGRWVGAKLGLFAIAPDGVAKSGYVDVDWFRFVDE